MEEKDNFEIKKSYKWIFILLLILIILSLISYSIYYYIKINNPKVVFMNNIKETYNYISDSLDIDKLKSKNKYITSNITSKVKFNDNKYINIEDIVDKIELNLNIGQNEKKLYLDIFSKYKQEDLLNVSLISENKEIYLFLEKLYDKYIKLPSIYNSLEENESDDLMNIEASAIKEAIKKIEYSFQKTKNNNAKVISITNIKEVVEAYYNYLESNDEYINITKNLQNNEKDEIILELNKQKSKYLYNANKIKINMYTTLISNDLIKLELIYKKENYTIEKNNNKFAIKYFDNDIIKDEINFELNKSNIILNFNDVSSGFDITINIKYDIQNKEIDTRNIKDSIPYEEIDINKIEENLLKQKGIKSLLEDISSNEEIANNI